MVQATPTLELQEGFQRMLSNIHVALCALEKYEWRITTYKTRRAVACLRNYGARNVTHSSKYSVGAAKVELVARAMENLLT